ncbi:MAG: hypothetical protein ABEK01_01535 [Candidatus Nanohaloarchaea archaeon]
MSRKCSLLTYNTKRENFESVYERNKFYRGLFGYTQTVKRNGKVYEYDKEGILDEVPNVRIDDSVFIIPQEQIGPVKEYLMDWTGKVSHHVFTVIVEEKEILEEIRTENDDTKGELE